MIALTGNKYKKKSLALMIAASLATGSAYSAEDKKETDDEEEKGVQTIVVTARKTEESIQQVPVSITAFSADTLADMGVATITDIQQYTPNSTLQVSRGTNTTLTAYIRGIGQQDPLWGFEPGVGIYVDDIYIARPQGAVMDVLDLERIEVLRGPQGTLYGKNTIGGAIKYVTRAMSGDNEFSVDTAFGSFNQRDLKLAGQVAVVDDKFYLGYAYANLTRDGFGEFVNTGDENYNKDISTGRLTLEYQPTDDVFVRFAYDDTQDDSNARGGYRLTPSLVTGQQPYDSVFDSDASLPVFNKVDTSGTSLTVKWDLSDEMAVKYVGAQREGATRTNIDFDNTSVNTFDVPAVYDDEQETHEILFNYSGDGMQAVAGIYSYDGQACGAFDVILGLAGITLENGGCVDTKSTALYAQTSFDLADQWSMTLGGRFTKDKKEASVYRHVFLGSVTPEDDVAPLVVQSDFDASKDWSEFTPRVGVEYQASDDMMYYASFAQGFKSGGFDMRANQSVNPQADDPFGPEFVDTYELGVKSDWYDGQLRVNGAFFFSDYQDMQVTVQRAVGVNDFATQVVNAGESEISGFELESIAAVSDDLTLNLSVGFIDAEFVRVDFFDPNLGETVDVSDTWVISNTPEWSVNLGADYTFTSSVGDFVLNGNLAYRSETNIFEIPSELDMGSYSLLNLSLNWFHPDGQWKAGLHVKNATDEEYRIAGYNFPAVFDGQGNLVAPGLGGEDTVIGYYGDPRTVALTIGYQF